MWDKALIRMYVACMLISFIVIFILVLSAIIFRRKLNRHYVEKELLLLANIEEGERMMNQIAKEVHDNIGQLSNILRMTLRRLEKTTDEKEKVKLFANANHFADLIISNSGNISHSLNSDFIKARGLFNIIQDDVEHIKAIGKIACSVHITGDLIAMNPDKELIIYRIAQEAMSNAIKYSAATEMKVLLESANNTFRMSIIDNGVGFDKNDIKNTHGSGLNNMEYRARMVKGELMINTAPNAGCEVVLLIKKPDLINY